MGARWIWVSLDYATFGIVTENGRVTKAPPIARWAVGRDEREVAAFYRRKGAVFRDVPVQVRATATVDGLDGWGATRLMIAKLENLGYGVIEWRIAGRSVLAIA